MSNEQKVYEFLKGNRDVHVGEIASGTNLSREIVEAILEAVVSAGVVIKTGTLNTATYNLAGATAPAIPPLVDRRSADQIWSDEARKKGIAEYERLHPTPKPEIAAVPKAEDIILPPPAAPLTEDEKRELEIMHRNRQPIVNPNAYLVR